jgi:uncharacterized damage-inducible protein DinB
MVSLALSVILAASTAAPAAPPTTLRGVLLEQLKTTHNAKDWFVPANTAVDGLTAEQAKWNDGKGNHSVGQLAAHLIFWNREQLAKFKGETPPKFSGDNNETFNGFDAAKWAQTQKDLDAVLSEWEKAVETADEAKLAQWASTIAHIGAHNAYHIGQMIYVRKQAGNWDPEKGVK